MARLSRLCSLISNFLEPTACIPSGVSEKQLLLSLSSVYKEIQKLCQLQDLEDGTLDSAHNCVAQAENGSEGKSTCLANIVLTMVSFFEHDNEFVQHLAASIFFQISTSLDEANIICVKFVLFVWIVLANAMSSICGCALPCCLFQNAPFVMEITEQLGMANSEIESFISILQSRHANLASRTVLGLFQVLHRMTKYLKNKEVNHGGELEHKYIVLSVKFLQSLPWDFYKEIDVGSSKLKSILSGCILQFVCSLVQTNDSEDSPNSSLEVSNLYLELGDLLPKFLSCFFGLSDGSDKCLVQYMRHKTLMLMIRLSFHAHKMETSCIISLLKTLKQYFPDLIYAPFSKCIITPNCCLEESPFSSSCSSELVSQNPQTRHLQRQALLLLFKCCFRLVQANNGSEKEQCFCEKNNSLVDYEICCCCSNIGWSEISDCLKCQVDTLKSPMDFGLSFLQLFMDEDNMLFCMLLQFLDASAVAFHIESKRTDYNELHLLSSIINPVRLFHILLFSLKYDHMVLIDYLASKDTGILCARYLLRCLRFVSESWPSFAEFSASQSEVIDANNKRRKLFDEDGGFTSSTAFVDAKDCLGSLKNTLGDLHRKNLFPYNPKALLRSLTRFQGLCGQDNE